MKVVFVQDLPNVAEEGDVKEVKRGHARNYLFPKGFAVPATLDELKRVDARQRAAAKRREEQQSEAQGLAGTIEGVSLVFAKKVTSKGNIYGSVSSTAILQELKQLGHNIEKSMIKLDEPLKQLGEYEVGIDLAKDVIAKIKVTIEAAEGEAVEATAVDEPAETVAEEPEAAVAEEPEETVAEKPEAAVAEEPEETVAEKPEAAVAEEPEETVAEKPEEMVAEETPEAVTEEPTNEEN